MSKTLKEYHLGMTGDEVASALGASATKTERFNPFKFFRTKKYHLGMTGDEVKEALGGTSATKSKRFNPFRFFRAKMYHLGMKPEEVKEKLEGGTDPTKGLIKIFSAKGNGEKSGDYYSIYFDTDSDSFPIMPEVVTIVFDGKAYEGIPVSGKGTAIEPFFYGDDWESLFANYPFRIERISANVTTAGEHSIEVYAEPSALQLSDFTFSIINSSSGTAEAKILMLNDEGNVIDWVTKQVASGELSGTAAIRSRAIDGGDMYINYNYSSLRVILSNDVGFTKQELSGQWRLNFTESVSSATVTVSNK